MKNSLIIGVVLSLLIVFMPASFADDSEKTLELGFFPYISGSRIIKLYRPLVEYLQRELNREVKLFSAPSFSEFVKRTNQQKYDIIFTAPHFALHAEKRGAYIRLVRFENRLRGYVFTQAEQPVESVAELKGKVIAMPDKLAIISSMGEVYLREKGLRVNTDYTIVNTASHNNTILTVINNKADAGIIARPVYNMYVKKNPGKIKLLAETQEIPGPMFMMRTSLSNDFKAQIKKAFNGFADSDYGKSFFKKAPFSGMKNISDQEMQQLQEYLLTIEGDLK